MKCQKNKFDLKIGNYIRTTSGKIRKIISLYDTGDVFVETHSCIKQENIVSSSNNIIDLVEIGDYVNGYKVIKIFINKFNNKKVLISLQREEEYEYSDDLSDYMCDESIHIYLENIKYIVTKEKFENIIYKVGDNLD